MMVISRVVIVPEFQGLGIGIKFMNAVADVYKEKGERVTIITSLKPFIKSLKRNPSWKCIRFGRAAAGSKINTSSNRITGSFEYKKVSNV